MEPDPYHDNMERDAADIWLDRQLDEMEDRKRLVSLGLMEEECPTTQTD